MASSSSRNKVVLVDSDIEVIEDSEPERQKKLVRQGSASSHASTSSSTRVVGSSKAIDTLASEDSDIELISAGPTVLRDTTNSIKSFKPKTKRKVDVGGFKSASKLLKEEVKKQKSSSPLPEASLVIASNSKDKGKQKEVIEDFDFDDEVLELPPPLRSTSEPKGSAGTAAVEADHAEIISKHGSQTSDNDSPASAFRSKISGFKAPAQSRKPSSSKSLFAPDTSARARSASSIPASAASSMSDSSTSSSTKPTLSRPKSTSAVPTKPPQLLIPTPFLTFITSCPVCKDVWTTIKTTTSKLAHIRKCATSKGFQEKTVLELVERQVREIQTSVEDERRRVENERTLFENILSKRGKDVQVVGVEQKQKGKKKQAVGNSSGSDIENQPALADRPAVMYTQGGSAHSQATSTQVQREIDAKIKVNQKVTRGDFVSILQPAGQSVTSKAPANGVGSKNWQKAAELLAARTAASNSETSADTSIASTSGLSATKVTKTGKLESYATSRFRLAEKAMQISAARAAPIVLSDNDSSDSGTTSLLPHNNDLFPRPYRNTGTRSVSLIDNASAIAKNLDYNLWSLAGAAQDTVPDRMVSTSSSPASPSRVAAHHHSPSSPQRLSVMFASASLLTSPSAAAPATQMQPFSTSSSSGLFASSAALQALTDRMKASSSRPTATALRKAREEKEKERLEEEATGAALVNPRSSVDADTALQKLKKIVQEEEKFELDSDAATDSSADIPLAKTAGPVKKPRGRPPKNKEDAGPSSSVVFPKRKKVNKTSAESDSADPSTEAVKPKRKTKKLDTANASNSVTTKASSLTASMPVMKKSSKSASTATKKATTASAQAPTASMPDYAAWDKVDLQAETARYGYKASGSKAVLVSQLTRVWQALHPGEAIPEADSDGSTKATPAKAGKKVRESTPPWKAKPNAPAAEGSGSDSLPEVSPVKKATKARKASSPAVKVSKAKAAAKKKKEQAAEGEVDTESDAEELKTAGERLREVILEDQAFYLRLLRYEPICFTDFEDLAIKAKVKLSKIALRDWLDSQAIIFYYPQDTGRNASRNGKKKRHP